MQWVWNEKKAEANYRKHGITFETAVQIFDDPFLLTQADAHSDNDRWQSIGRVYMTTLFVVHAEFEDAQTGRIISARRASAAERKLYETLRF